MQKTLTKTPDQPLIRLTPKQEAFCLEYSRTGKQIASYRAVYNTKASDHNAQTEAKRVLAKSAVRERLAQLRLKTEKTSILSAQQILEELTLINADKDGFARDRLKALELLGKYRKLFTERIELKAPDGQALVILQLADRLRDARTRSRVDLSTEVSAEQKLLA